MASFIFKVVSAVESIIKEDDKLGYTLEALGEYRFMRSANSRLQEENKILEARKMTLMEEHITLENQRALLAQEINCLKGELANLEAREQVLEARLENDQLALKVQRVEKEILEARVTTLHAELSMSKLELDMACPRDLDDDSDDDFEDEDNDEESLHLKLGESVDNSDCSSVIELHVQEKEPNDSDNFQTPVVVAKECTCEGCCSSTLDEVVCVEVIEKVNPSSVRACAVEVIEEVRPSSIRACEIEVIDEEVSPSSMRACKVDDGPKTPSGNMLFPLVAVNQEDLRTGLPSSLSSDLDKKTALGVSRTPLLSELSATSSEDSIQPRQKVNRLYAHTRSSLLKASSYRKRSPYQVTQTTDWTKEQKRGKVARQLLF